MAISMAPLLVWSVLATTSVLIVLQLERRCIYNWFAILSPLWFSDVCLLTRAAVSHRNGAMGRCRGQSGRSTAYYLCAVACKLMFEVLVASKLQYYGRLSMFAVMTPLWLLLTATLVNLGRRVFSQFRLYNEKLV